MSDYDMFKTTLMGGFDKDDVIQKVQEIKDQAYREQSRLEREVRVRDEKIVELTKRLELKEAQREKLERDIKEKYQSYIDHYDSIGRLVYEAKVQATQMLEEARTKSEAMIAEAEKEAGRRMAAVDEEAEKRVAEVQMEVNEKLAEGKKRYIAVQEEMNEVVELINQAQRRFMASYKEVHQIVSSMPASLWELEDDGEEEPAVYGEPEVQEPEEDAFDEEDETED